jgi:superfamily II DNA or RNA helicase
MPEALAPPPELDIARAQETLGVAVQVDPAARPTSYDEKWAILERALAIRTATFTADIAAAEAAGIQLDEAMLANWPDSNRLAYMQQALARERKKVGMLNGIDSYVARQDAHEQAGGTQLRWNQDNAMHKIQKFMHTMRPSSWQTSGKSGLINSATGTGKTGIFSKLTAVMKYGEHAEEPVRVLILTPRRTILEQTKAAFAKFAPRLAVGRYYEDLKELQNVTVISQASFDALMARGELPDYDVVIADEAHRVGQATERHLRSYCIDKILLGVTATPTARTRALFEHEIHKHDLREAVQDGILAPVRGQNVLAEPNWEQYQGQLPTNPTELRRAKRQLRLEHWKVAAIPLVEDAVKRGVGVVIRCPAGEDIKFAKDYAEFLRERFVLAPPDQDNTQHKLQVDLAPRIIRAMAIGGQEQAIKKEGLNVIKILKGAALKRLQNKALDDFQEGEVDVLLYVSAIGLGWDSPRAKVFIDMDPTRSETEVKQALGRALRLWEEEDNTTGRKIPIKAYAYSFIDPDFEGQYTVCDALNLKSGESIEHLPVVAPPEAHDVESPDDEEDSEERADWAELFEDGSPEPVSVIGEVALEHAPPAESDDNDEILTHGEALARSGLSPLTFQRFWRQRGLGSDDLIFDSELHGGLAELWETNTQLRPQPLPSSGYMHENEVLARANRTTLKAPALRQVAFWHGYAAQRFITNDNRIGFYYAEADVPEILAKIRKLR